MLFIEEAKMASRLLNQTPPRDAWLRHKCKPFKKKKRKINIMAKYFNYVDT